MPRQPWIGPPWFDLTFILGPAFAVTGAVLAFPGFFTHGVVTPVLFAVLIVGVDVGHVYSTLFRTYLDPAALARRPTLYLLAPILGFLGFAAFYSLGAMVFWRVLAYLAAFHFVRQQYGFMMIYSRFPRTGRGLDRLAIYGATLAPLLWWHTHGRSFSWFMPGDFLVIHAPALGNLVLAAYALILATYAVKEAMRGPLNIPRNLLLGGTVLSWGVGIVALDSDLAFTATNVLAHGIPYLALVWLDGRRRGNQVTLFGLLQPGRVFRLAALPLFLGVPLLLAYGEEGFWDRFVWFDHPRLFAPFDFLPRIDAPEVLAWLVPLLALPQITHYILDGFIWRGVGVGEPGGAALSVEHSLMPEGSTHAAYHREDVSGPLA